jgi:BioD-like phosphotransacetylase family protein
MSDTTQFNNSDLIEQILTEHDSIPEINCVLIENRTFLQERKNSKTSLIRFQNALKAMPKIIDEQGKVRRPTSKGWVLKISNPFKTHTGHSVNEIENTKNLPLLKLLTRVRNEAAEIVKSVIDLPEISESDYEQLKKDFDSRIAALFQAEMNHDN